jgi:hypothetical protein
MVTKRFAGSGSTITKALQYLTLTCPYIAYVDFPIYACLHDFPLSSHQIVFCVTSKGCLILTYNFPLTCDLVAYSAADWAGAGMLRHPQVHVLFLCISWKQSCVLVV